MRSRPNVRIILHPRRRIGRRLSWRIVLDPTINSRRRGDIAWTVGLIILDPRWSRSVIVLSNTIKYRSNWRVGLSLVLVGQHLLLPGVFLSHLILLLKE